MSHVRTRPHVVVYDTSPYNYARNAVPLNLIVVHTTQGHNRPGISDLQNLGTWFSDNPYKVAAHVGVDDEGQSARYVGDARKCYHVGKFNSASLGLEQIGFASQTSWKQAQIEESARWVAQWSIEYDIPIRKGAVLQDGTVARSGVLQHADLGQAGGNHTDCGPAYPFAKLISLAIEFRDRRVHPAYSTALKLGVSGPHVQTWQAQMAKRGFAIYADGQYGPQSEAVCRAFEQEIGVTVNGMVGADVWNAAWEFPIH